MIGKTVGNDKTRDTKISVIICCYSTGRQKDVQDAANSVLTQSYKPYEVIIAVDHTREVFQKLTAALPSSVKIVLNEGMRGLSETRNTGIRASNGSIIAFIDDDAISTFSPENSYLRFLLFKALMEILIPPWAKSGLSQSIAIILSVMAVGAGYIKGKVRLT